MELTRDLVLHVAALARLDLTEEEVELFRTQLSAILDHARVLQTLDLESRPPTATVSTARNVMRSDVPAPSLSRADALHNAPSVVDSRLEVKAVLEEG